MVVKLANHPNECECVVEQGKRRKMKGNQVECGELVAVCLDMVY